MFGSRGRYKLELGEAAMCPGVWGILGSRNYKVLFKVRVLGCRILGNEGRGFRFAYKGFGEA